MALKKFNHHSSQRGLVLVDKSALHKGGPVKKLTEGLTKTIGRNIPVISPLGKKVGVTSSAIALWTSNAPKLSEATVQRIEYDPNRTAFIALITYADGEQSYILAPQRLVLVIKCSVPLPI